MDLPDGWSTDAVRVDGVTLQTYSAGEGPPILLAHGLYDHGRRWIPLAEDLVDEYQVVAYDARGHGRSDAPESGYGLDDRVADLRGVVDGLDLADPVLVGHSMGAVTAAWTAARRPELPRGLVLEDPVGIDDEPDMDSDELAAVIREQVEEADDKTADELIEEHYSDVDPDHARRLASASHECSPRIAAMAREGYLSPLRDAFPDIACRTLVLRRDADAERRISDLDAVDSLRDGRLVHVPDAGHYVFRDEYDAALAELRVFLRRVE